MGDKVLGVRSSVSASISVFVNSARECWECRSISKADSVNASIGLCRWRALPLHDEIIGVDETNAEEAEEITQEQRPSHQKSNHGR